MNGPIKSSQAPKLKRTAKRPPESMEQALRIGLRKAVPLLVTAMSDMFEKRPRRLTKRDKRAIENVMDQYVRRTVPLIKNLETLDGDPLRFPENENYLNFVGAEGLISQRATRSVRFARLRGSE